MKYTPSALVSEFSGKQGSTVASHNRFGPYFRNRVIPVNPNTTTQQNARNDLALATRGWAALTSAQRAAWNAAASFITLYDRLGRPYNPTGHQYYIAVNRTTYVYSGATTAVTAPPSAAAPVALVTLAPTATAGIPSFSVVYTATPLAALTKLLVETTAQMSAGISFVGRSQYRQIQVSAAAQASPFNILAAWNAKFGALVAGKQIFIRATVLTSDGQRSAPLATSIIVGA
jgi:hypothetical protein